MWVALVACGSKPSAIAELTKADGPVERQHGAAAWSEALLGTQYFLGDAARTADRPAELKVVGGAQIVMQGRTVVRFGGTREGIAVEVGTIDMSGEGVYALDIGELRLNDSTVRISANLSGGSTVELRIGSDAKIGPPGQTLDLAIGKPVVVNREGTPPIDAGVRAAPADAAVDAAVDAAGPSDDIGALIEVTGKRAEIQARGGPWKPLPAGAGELPRGSTVKLGPNTTAKLTTSGTALALSSGSQVTFNDDLGLALNGGGIVAEATAPVTLGVPGGTIALDGAPGASSKAKIEISPRESKVTMLSGGSKLTGAGGADLAMRLGESASLGRAGTIRVIEAIPTYFDFRAVPGESFTIHDPNPPTSVQFLFHDKCPDGGVVEVDRDPRFRTAKVSGGRESANVRVAGPTVFYRMRCTLSGAEGAAVTSGRIVALRDDGRRPLPKNQGINDIDADGRNYRISYQSAIPSVAVHVGTAGSAHRLHLASGGKEQTFDSSAATILVPGPRLHEGTYAYWVDRDGVRQDRVSTLAIDFDQTAPQVYIESPINGQPWTGDIDVRGAVLPDWTAAVDQSTFPIDNQRRFGATVGVPAGNALAIKLSHPQRGIHYYLRRPK